MKIAVTLIVTVQDLLGEVETLDHQGMNAHFIAMISIGVHVVEAFADLRLRARLMF